MWIVTIEYNEYNQQGEYFLAAYLEKPTFKQLKKLIGEDDVTVGKLTRGGERQGEAYTWYNLFEATEGENYHDNL